MFFSFSTNTTPIYGKKLEKYYTHFIRKLFTYKTHLVRGLHHIAETLRYQFSEVNSLIEKNISLSSKPSVNFQKKCIRISL